MSDATPTLEVVPEPYRDVVERFRTEAKALVAARAEVDREAAALRASRFAEIDDRVAAVDALDAQTTVLASAVAAHAAVRDLEEPVPTPPATVHGDVSDASFEFLRQIYVRRRERALAVLQGLVLPAEGEAKPAAAPRGGAPHGPAEPTAAEVRVGGPATGEGGLDADRVGADASQGLATAPAALDAPVAAPPLNGSPTPRRCPYCGTEAPAAAERCSNCSRRITPYTFRPDDDATEGSSSPAPASGGSRVGGLFVLFAVLLVAAVVGMNLWPASVQRVTFVCSVPLLNDLVPCEDIVPRTSGSGTPVAGAASSGATVRSATEVAARLAAISQAGGGTLTLGAGVFEVRAPLTLSGDVTIRGAGRDQSVLRLVGTSGGVLYVGGGTLSLSDVGLVLATSGAGDVLSVSGGSARFERIAVTGGSGGTGIPGAGLFFSGRATGTVRDCLVQANAYGVWVATNATPSISGCTIAGNYARGVSYHDQSGGELIDTTIEGNGFARARNDYWQGIALQDRANPVIRDNAIRDNAGIGVQYRDASGGSFSGNRVTGNGSNITRYAPSTASSGGVAIGARGTSQRPNPSIGGGNTYANNYGGGIVDYR